MTGQPSRNARVDAHRATRPRRRFHFVRAAPRGTTNHGPRRDDGAPARLSVAGAVLAAGAIDALVAADLGAAADAGTLLYPED